MNLGHSRIEESDIEKGLGAYSDDLVRDIGLEIRDTALPTSRSFKHSPGMTAKTKRPRAMRDAYRHRRQLTFRMGLRSLDFLSVGDEFGADARSARKRSKASF